MIDLFAAVVIAGLDYVAFYLIASAIWEKL